MFAMMIRASGKTRIAAANALAAEIDKEMGVRPDQEGAGYDYDPETDAIVDASTGEFEADVKYQAINGGFLAFVSKEQLTADPLFK